MVNVNLRGQIRDDWQEDYLTFTGNTIVMGGRQIGKSDVTADKLAQYLLKNKDKKVLIVSGVERQASTLYDMTQAYIDKYKPSAFKEGKDRPLKTEFALKNGSVLITEPVGLTGAGARRHTLNGVVFEEMQLIPDEAFAAITPMLLTTGGWIWLLGTAWGTTGYAYERLSDKDFKVFWIDAENVAAKRPEPQRTIMLNFLEKEKIRLTKARYDREYKAIPQSNLKLFFDPNLVKELSILERRDKISETGAYYGGSDIAAMGEDDSTFEILDGINREAIEQVENIANVKLFPYRVAEKIINLNEAYNFKKYGIDDGGLGIDVLGICLKHTKMRNKIKALNNASRPITIQRTDINGKVKEPEEEVSLLKEEMYVNLLSLMEQRKIRFLKDRSIAESFASVLYEVDEVTKKMKVYGLNTHVVEGLIRAAWVLCEDKSLKVWAS